jgi:hypothetical protein
LWKAYSPGYSPKKVREWYFSLSTSINLFSYELNNMTPSSSENKWLTSFACDFVEIQGLMSVIIVFELRLMLSSPHLSSYSASALK